MKELTLAERRSHIEEHIKGLQIALEGAGGPEECEYIQNQIDSYRRDWNTGYLAPECIQQLSGAA